MRFNFKIIMYPYSQIALYISSIGSAVATLYTFLYHYNLKDWAFSYGFGYYVVYFGISFCLSLLLSLVCLFFIYLFEKKVPVRFHVVIHVLILVLNLSVFQLARPDLEGILLFLAYYLPGLITYYYTIHRRKETRFLR